MSIYEVVPDLPQIKKQDYDKVVMFLTANKEQYFRSKEISENCGFSKAGSSIYLRAMIANLRDKGCPIVSSSLGYSWTNDRKKVKKCIENLQARIQGINRAIIGLNKAVWRMY